MGVRRAGAVTAKGGINLRLFFGSVRYSADMDLDGTVEGSAAIRNCLKGLFDAREFTRRLQAFGIRGLDPGEGPNKDTETTFRYKFGVIAGGGVRYPTKVEVSFRKRHAVDRVVLETPSSGVLDAHGVDTFQVRHYVREAAVRQKIDALGGRREAQARDVFDIHVLVPDAPTDELLAFLAKALRRERLEEAHARALAIRYSEYQGQVFEFLGDAARSGYASESMWDEMRLRAAALIEGVLQRQEQE
ncbi:MAG: nucleotidyl transferase AbiEii/AbiGii toxin family protein [Gemmatimonadetes bacterium]|nr:nucleotidyl transferase AbiEii/AbiGii toxin family protein [Gemmatimonadota bacterium]MBI2402302.1 nucleotidyl transferase AbiEii/AbiGii toxin family protein [Gemmatimonadota bacterium]